jgi:CPA2 family monovalent cation:H+ antiporter-2
LQDLLFAPVLTSYQFIGKAALNVYKLISAIGASVIIFILFKKTRDRKTISLPFFKELEKDLDLQILAGAAICFGFALLASKFGLTASFGVFVAGLFIVRTDAFEKLENAMKPFKVFFMCLFFLSIGLMVDVRHLINHYQVILGITFSVMIINSILSMLVFKLLKYEWRTSLYAGALLSQIGEYSLLASTLAFQTHIIEEEFYKHIFSVCCLSLLISTIWISILRIFIFKEHLGILSAKDEYILLKKFPFHYRFSMAGIDFL